MSKFHFLATWSPDKEMFKVVLGLDVDGNPVNWHVKNDEFLKGIEHAEKDCQIQDGQNKIGKINCQIEFVDEKNENCVLKLDDIERSAFRGLVKYLRKVYDSWCKWQHGSQTIR